MRDVSDKSMCGKVTECIYKCGLVTSMLVLLCIFWIQHSVAANKYLMSLERQEALQLLSDVCLLAFVGIYLVLSCQVFMKYRIKGKVCTFTNCTFVSVSALIIYFSIWILGTVYSDRDRYVADFSQSCADIQFSLDNTSVFQEADQVTQRAADLLCSQTCPCTLKVAGLYRTLQTAPIENDEDEQDGRTPSTAGEDEQVFVPREDPSRDIGPMPAPEPAPVHIILDELSDDEL